MSSEFTASEKPNMLRNLVGIAKRYAVVPVHGVVDFVDTVRHLGHVEPGPSGDYYYHFSQLAGGLVPEGPIEELHLVDNRADRDYENPSWDDRFATWLTTLFVYRPLAWIRRFWVAGYFNHITTGLLLITWIIMVWVCTTYYPMSKQLQARIANHSAPLMIY